MKQFRCGDLVPGCDAVYEGSVEDILTAVHQHAVENHDLPGIPPERLPMIREAMTDLPA